MTESAETEWVLNTELGQSLADIGGIGPHHILVGEGPGPRLPPCVRCTALPVDDPTLWLVDSRSKAEPLVHVEVPEGPEAQRLLLQALAILRSRDLEGRPARWRFATRLVETEYREIQLNAAAGQPDAVRMLPLVTWFRWRLLSEPLRNPEIVDYVAGTFGGNHTYLQRARQAQVDWADTLLRYQDHPMLDLINVEHEGRFLVFADDGEKTLIEWGDNSFSTWFSREFFSRRFMVAEMWRVEPSRMKWWGAVALGAAFFVALVVWCLFSLFLPETTPILVVGSVGLGIVGYATVVTGIVIAGAGFGYPFLLRFAAGIVIGSVAVITLRAGWVSWLAEAESWHVATFLSALALMGFGYLVVEARAHGTDPAPAVGRAFVVWFIGFVHAVILATISVAVLAPIFTEEWPWTPYLLELNDATGFTLPWRTMLLLALASLSLGIFLQVLWEDRPVTYPLGALRFSRHE